MGQGQNRRGGKRRGGEKGGGSGDEERRKGITRERMVKSLEKEKTLAKASNWVQRQAHANSTVKIMAKANTSRKKVQ